MEDLIVLLEANDLEGSTMCVQVENRIQFLSFLLHQDIEETVMKWVSEEGR